MAAMVQRVYRVRHPFDFLDAHYERGDEFAVPNDDRRLVRRAEKMCPRKLAFVGERAVSGGSRASAKRRKEA